MERFGKFRWVAIQCLLGVAIACTSAMAQVTTATIADTVYRADGTYAGGSLLISWPEFTTGSSQAVPAGHTTAPIGANGVVSIGLAPNAGADPAGTYYTVVYQLNDGTVSTEYWVVPATGTATIASVRSQVVPASVAVQSATVSYVNGAVSDAVSGYLPLSGGSLAGPLNLSQDPAATTEAATKHYVDTSVASASGSAAGKVILAPTGSQSVQQPAGTTLSVNSLANVQYAAPNQTGAGNNGISNAFASSTCAGGGCMVVADPGYSMNEIPPGHPFPSCLMPGGGYTSYCAYNWPFNSRLWDQRGGIDLFSYQDPLSPYANIGIAHPLSYPAGLGNSGMARQYTYDYVADRGNSQLIPEVRLMNSFSGGHNGGGGYTKSNYTMRFDRTTYFSQGQHAIGQRQNFCLGLGDCMGDQLQLYYSVGMSRGGDEGIHRGDSSIDENFWVFNGTITAGASTGSVALKVNPASGTNGDQGEGRYLVDLSRASGGGLGTVTGSGQSAVGSGQITGWVSNSTSTPPQMVAPSGTFVASTLLGTTTTAVTASGGVVGSQTVTISITAGAPSATTPVCISDADNYELAAVSAATSTSVTATFIRTHGVGALITQGGTCGWFLALNSETLPAGSGAGNASTIRYMLPLVGSVDAAHTYYWYTNGGSYSAIMGSTSSGLTPPQSGTSVAWTYLNANATATYNSSTGLVTINCCGFYDHGVLTTNAGVGNLYGQAAAITTAGSDSTYATVATFGSTNGAGAAVITGPGTFTYTPAGTPTAGSEAVTVTVCNCTFTMYPGAEVTGVFNASTNQVDGTIALAANSVPWTTGDAVEEPHWHQPYVNDTHDVITPLTPMLQLPWGRGYSYKGMVTGGLNGIQLSNNASNSLYYGYGGTHNPPASAVQIRGYWKTLVGGNAPDSTVIGLGCKPASPAGGDGCTKWDADYALFQLAGSGVNNWEYYWPQSNTAMLNYGAVKLYVGNDVTNTSQYINPTIGSPGLALTGAGVSLYTPSLTLNGGAALTSQTGTGASVVTNNGPTIAGTTTVANLTVSGSCTGCGGGGSTVPGVSGQMLMSNGSGGFGTPVSTTGSGTVVMATGPTLSTPNLNSPTVNSVLNMAAGAWISLLSATATSGTQAVSSSAVFYDASVWNGSAACGLNPYMKFQTSSPSNWTMLFGGVNRTTCSGVTPVIQADFSGFVDGIIVPHVLTTGGATTPTAPTVAAGSGAGGSATVTLSNARDTDGTITVTTGTSPSASSVVATVTFGTPFQGVPNCQVTPASASAMNTVYSPPSGTTGFTVNAGATALAASTSYSYTYHCLQ